jgi:hypothetical protein
MQQTYIKVGKVRNIIKNALSQLRNSIRLSYLFDYLTQNLRRVDHGIMRPTSVVHSRLFARFIVLMLENVTENADVR